MSKIIGVNYAWYMGLNFKLKRLLVAFFIDYFKILYYNIAINSLRFFYEKIFKAAYSFIHPKRRALC